MALSLSALATACSDPAEPAGQDAAAPAGADAATAAPDASQALDAEWPADDAGKPDGGGAPAGLDAGKPDGGGAPAGLDAATSSDAAAQAGTDAATPSGKKLGSIQMIQACTADAGPESCTAYVLVDYRDWPKWPPGDCVISTIGNCEIQECSSAIPDGGIVAPPVQYPGTITIESPRLDGGVALAFSDAGNSGSFAIPSGIWMAGDGITVSAAGGAAPGFGAKTLVGPSDIAVTAPACAGGSCGSVSRAAPLTVAWTGDTTVVATVYSQKLPESVVVQCWLSTSPGTIEAAVMARLQPTAAGFSNNIYITPMTRNDFVESGWEVKLRASANASNGWGSFVTSD